MLSKSARLGSPPFKRVRGGFCRSTVDTELDDLYASRRPQRTGRRPNGIGRWFVHQHTFRSSRCVIPGRAAGAAGRAADQVGDQRRPVFGPWAGTPGPGTQARRL